MKDMWKAADFQFVYSVIGYYGLTIHNTRNLTEANCILLPNPAMSSTPMKLEDVWKGKHWFTRVTT